MSEEEGPQPTGERQGREEPFTGPGPGHPTEETLPEESQPAGEAELSQEDVGFGRKERGEQRTPPDAGEP